MVNAAPFELIPAIDLRAGRVVRLVRGEFDRETVFATDPETTADEFIRAGAARIHIVDLDGARSGSQTQRTVIRSIANRVGDRARIQIAGGLRSERDVTGALELAGRVVLGTALLAEPGFARRIVAEHGADRIVAALDVRDGRAVGDGWVEGGFEMSLDAALDRLALAGLRCAVVTAIARDGGLAGPDLDLLGRLAGDGRLEVIASGGIRSVDDLVAVRAAGCSGAIVGRALYEGRLDVAAAIVRLSAPLQSGQR